MVSWLAANFPVEQVFHKRMNLQRVCSARHHGPQASNQTSRHSNCNFLTALAPKGIQNRIWLSPVVNNLELEIQLTEGALAQLYTKALSLIPNTTENIILVKKK